MVLATLKVIQGKVCQLAASQTTTQQDSDDCTISLALKRLSIRELPESTSLDCREQISQAYSELLQSFHPTDAGSEFGAHLGFTPMEALRSVTTTPAAYFKQETKFGSVEPGQTADLVLLDADPLKDIRNTQRIAGVVANGKWWDRSDLDRLLRDVARDARAECRPKSAG